MQNPETAVLRHKLEAQGLCPVPLITEWSVLGKILQGLDLGFISSFQVHRSHPN